MLPRDDPKKSPVGQTILKNGGEFYRRMNSIDEHSGQVIATVDTRRPPWSRGFRIFSKRFLPTFDDQPL